MGSNGNIFLSWHYRDAVFHVLFIFKKNVVITASLFPLARRMQRRRIKINLCVWQLWVHRLIIITTSFSDSHHMLLPSIAQRQNDWNSIHLWIPTFDSAFNWVLCTLKCMHYMLWDAHTPATHTHTANEKWAEQVLSHWFLLFIMLVWALGGISQSALYHLCSFMKWKL